MEELELTYLVRELPEGVLDAPRKDMLDIYLPAGAAHPTLRVRKSGERYEITKKQPLKEGDASHQLETTIPLTEAEFVELGTLSGKRVEKTRYIYEEDGVTYEIDVFQGPLAGLVLADVEFGSAAEKDVFDMPAWCLADVTQEVFVAGGMLCGKSYADIERDLTRFAYKPLVIPAVPPI